MNSTSTLNNFLRLMAALAMMMIAGSAVRAYAQVAGGELLSSVGDGDAIVGRETITGPATEPTTEPAMLPAVTGATDTVGAGTEAPAPAGPTGEPSTGGAGAGSSAPDTGDSAAKTPGNSAVSPGNNLEPAEDLHPRITPEEYMDAGHVRYTMTGNLPYRESYIQTSTLTAFGGALLALAGTITWYQQAWYPDSTKGPFQFKVDWSYAKEFDKIGHAFGGWMSSYCSYEAFVASGLSKDDAAFWGTMGGLFFQTFIEVQDGFHVNYGFDWTDQLGNMAGAGYFYAQRKIPFLQNFDPKWSVGPTGRDSAREAAQIRTRLIVDDYDRQDMWLSVKVHNLLPKSLQPFWPKWLQLALGAGARDVELQGYTPYRVLHLSLDYNLVEMLPDLGPFGNWLVQGLNAFHLPAPALQLWPTVKFELIYPFRL